MSDPKTTKEAAPKAGEPLTAAQLRENRMGARAERQPAQAGMFKPVMDILKQIAADVKRGADALEKQSKG